MTQISNQKTVKKCDFEKINAMTCVALNWKGDANEWKFIKAKICNDQTNNCVHNLFLSSIRIVHAVSQSLW